MGQKTTFDRKVSIANAVPPPDFSHSKFDIIQITNHFLILCSNETQENDEETNISQEILVLDFGDEKSEFLRSGGTGASGESDFNGGKC